MNILRVYYSFAANCIFFFYIIGQIWNAFPFMYLCFLSDYGRMEGSKNVVGK